MWGFCNTRNNHLSIDSMANTRDEEFHKLIIAGRAHLCCLLLRCSWTGKVGCEDFAHVCLYVLRLDV